MAQRGRSFHWQFGKQQFYSVDAECSRVTGLWRQSAYGIGNLPGGQ
jgi:hypothetical protein